ncbi:AsnC family transcriptional regulator [Sphingobium sp. HBC34]|uniref:AsnC family transcriptional regulator n=1 Tax=Sphingobium cyanobacteriorum TaxID=3063954 RepID=A0ABT8ZRV8_9SPHN|nr:AsnC family transcriptional regulator [Sphingobium sp. HBC34]MDO7836455.1 AsnC family transcriptional regulator [Sphingobium sp. HBC34]
MKHDDLNEKIFSILSKNARTSNREVAQTLGISETAVRKRLLALEHRRSAKLTALISATAAGMSASAIVRLQVEPNHAHNIAGNLARVEQVSYVALATGRYNITVLVNATDREALLDTIRSLTKDHPAIHKVRVLETVAVAGMRPDVTFIRGLDDSDSRQ